MWNTPHSRYGWDLDHEESMESQIEDKSNKKEITHASSPNEDYFEELNDYLDGTMGV